MLEISGDWWYYDKDTNMIWASHNSSGILDTNIATLTDSNFDANNGRLIAAAPEMYKLMKIWVQVQAQPTLRNAQDKARELLERIDSNSLKGGEA